MMTKMAATTMATQDKLDVWQPPRLHPPGLDDPREDDDGDDDVDDEDEGNYYCVMLKVYS